MRNYLPATLERKALRILQGLEGRKIAQPAFVVLENQTVAIADSHCAFLPSKTGRKEFDQQLEIRRSKHAKDAEFLFNDTEFTWEDHVPGDRFQSLVRDLLNREPDTSRVRQVGAASEPDGGRDYLVEWATPLLPTEDADEGEPPSRTRRVVVQCKSDKKAVGRTQVTGVYDTMRHYDAGYLLVVRSRLTVPLMDILDGIRMEGTQFADWWEGIDVEERLRANPDLLDRYNDIVRPSR